MSTAVLPIDDTSTSNTSAFVDDLCERGSRAVMFAADTFWTFDFAEYQLHTRPGFLVEEIYRRIHDAHPQSGGALLEASGHHIVLLHDHDETGAILPRYYAQFLDCCMVRGVGFITPEFIAETQQFQGNFNEKTAK